jgi:Protein of unknown function (DUF2911)
MKKVIVSVIALLCIGFANAQQKPTELDKSPMDMSYCPSNYPVLKLNGKVKDQPLARVVYSRPQKSGRQIFGGIVKYNELWRLGANEATEIELFKDAKISGKKIAKGRYTLYCIPTETKWTIIFSKDNYSWGSFVYDAKKDVARIDITSQKASDSAEAFTMYFEDTKDGGNLIMWWDDVKASMAISF